MRPRRRCPNGGKCNFGFRKQEIIVTIPGDRKVSIGKRWACRKCGLWV